MKFKKIGTRMLVFILPVIIIAMSISTLVSVNSSKAIIEEQISSHMTSELNAQNGEILSYLNVISATATSLAATVSTTYKTSDLATYETMLSSIITTNDMISGSGIWFEPYVYDASEEYVGPYVFKDGDDISTTYSYSNADYDYFSQEYYTLAKASGKASITDPYYDSSSDSIMSSCSAPIYDGDTYIGCVTVDISLSSIQELANSITVGDGGTAMLLTADGVFMGGVDKEKIENNASITSDENTSLANAGNEIVHNESGVTTYKDGSETYNVYYDTIEGVNWTLAIRMPQSELNGPVNRLVALLLIICVAAIIASSLMIIYQVNTISKSLAKVKAFATSLAAGDFTIHPLQVKTADELGSMGDSLNLMYENNKDVITNISNHAVSIDDSSNELQVAAKKLLAEFEQTREHMTNINESMMAASAATEEVNASTEEVNSNVSLLANETEKSMDMAQNIRSRASLIEHNSRASFDSATTLSTQFEKRLAVSIENAKVVENIGDMANVISEIAEQINLLSLNASIEAARAGEQGKGFAVVASEIGKLANDTSEAVSRIQNTITDVNEAFQGLSTEASELLNFVQNTVTPDYNNFVQVANQYGQDAVSIESTSGKISEMTENIRHIMQEVTDAIQNIAESAQQTADVSSQIMTAVGDVSEVVTHVSDMSDQQESIATDLNDVVGNFKLD